MGIRYEIEADRDCQIPTIGDLVAGEVQELTEIQVAQFKAVFGYEVGAGHFPPGVKLSVIVEADEEGEGE